MDYRKERNFIVAYDDTERMRGKWNIQTNEYIGIKGGLVKTVPTAFKTYTDMPEYIRDVFHLIRRFYYRTYTNSLGNRIEQLMSLQMHIEDSYDTWSFLSDDTTSLTKDLIHYLNTACAGIYSRHNINSYKLYKEHKDLIAQCGEHKSWAMDVIGHIYDMPNAKEIPTIFIKGMVLRGIHEKVFITNPPYKYSQLIKDWYNMIMLLEDKLEVKHNVLTNYCILKYIYEEYRTAHYDEVLKKHNDLPWLYYENDSYVVFPLLTRKEFHLEAEAQHNCVERMYMERVYDGNTHVVVVRKKDAPDKPYITCEVSNERQIWQFLYRDNISVSRLEDLNFKNEYEMHLLQSPIEK